jgi:hypothetical protein
VATQVQFRRGTAAENNAFTGAVGEVTVDTTNTQLRVHDGSTPGGTNAGLESGTVAFFYQSAAPTGWTKDTAATLNDHALRVVTSTAWSTGSNGTDAFSATFSASKATDAYTLTTPDIPSHSHSGLPSGSQSLPGTSSYDIYGIDLTANTGLTGGGGSHTHDIAMDVKYINVIRATAD